MLRKSQSHQQQPESSSDSGLNLDRLAFEEIHPAFLDTLDEQTVPSVTGLRKAIYLVLAGFFFVLGVLARTRAPPPLW